MARRSSILLRLTRMLSITSSINRGSLASRVAAQWFECRSRPFSRSMNIGCGGTLVGLGRFAAEERRLDLRSHGLAALHEVLHPTVERRTVHQDAPLTLVTAQSDVRANSNDGPDAVAARVRFPHLHHVAHPHIEGHRCAGR